MKPLSTDSIRPVILVWTTRKLPSGFVKLLLTIAGYDVVTAASGEEGLEQFKRDSLTWLSPITS